MTKVYGYVRVSTIDQNEDRQLMALKEMHIPEKNIFIDKQSGKDFDRPAYKKLIKKLKKNDLLYIQSLDRFGRNYDEMTEQWRLLTKEIGIDICVIDMPLLDTRREKDLLGSFISDVAMSFLSFFADLERKNIKERQRQGIQAARERGVKFGRPRKMITEESKAIMEKYQKHEVSASTAARELGMSVQTFYRRTAEQKVEILRMVCAPKKPKKV